MMVVIAITQLMTQFRLLTSFGMLFKLAGHVQTLSEVIFTTKVTSGLGSDPYMIAPLALNWSYINTYTGERGSLLYPLAVLYLETSFMGGGPYIDTITLHA